MPRFEFFLFLLFQVLDVLEVLVGDGPINLLLVVIVQRVDPHWFKVLVDVSLVLDLGLDHWLSVAVQARLRVLLGVEETLLRIRDPLGVLDLLGVMYPLRVLNMCRVLSRNISRDFIPTLSHIPVGGPRGSMGVDFRVPRQLLVQSGHVPEQVLHFLSLALDAFDDGQVLPVPVVVQYFH